MYYECMHSGELLSPERSVALSKHIVVHDRSNAVERPQRAYDAIAAASTGKTDWQ